MSSAKEAEGGEEEEGAATAEEGLVEEATQVRQLLPQDNRQLVTCGKRQQLRNGTSESSVPALTLSRRAEALKSGSKLPMMICPS